MVRCRTAARDFFLLHRRASGTIASACGWVGAQAREAARAECAAAQPPQTTFRCVGIPENVRFVVTLDADTRCDWNGETARRQRWRIR